MNENENGSSLTDEQTFNEILAYEVPVHDGPERNDVISENEAGPGRLQPLSSATTGEVANELDIKRDIHIKHMHHGYLVEVDCHKFAFETPEKMLKYILQYLKDPNGTERKWWDKKLF